MQYTIVEIHQDGTEVAHGICDNPSVAITEIERLESDFPDRMYRLDEYNQSESNTK